MLYKIKNKLLFLSQKIFPKKNVKAKELKSYPIIENIIMADELLSPLALEAIRKILLECARINKNDAAALCEIANYLTNSGYPEIGESYYELSLKQESNVATYSLYLQNLLLNPLCTEEKMYHVARKYDELFLSHINKYENHLNDLTISRKLNIGYICHFFHNCISLSSLMPFLKAHNSERVKVVCYSDGEPNEVPEHIKLVPSIWRDTKHLNHDQLAELIREDKIDILIELNGHIVNNRYLVIAKKPAPIQISYYNIATTTGISTIDYLIVGDDMSLQDAQPYYTETIYNFKGVSGVIKFPDDFPDVSPMPPCINNNYITFGSFGQAHKVNRNVIILWCKVLKEIPSSKFYMKASVLDFEDYINSFKMIFENEGIDLNRIYFEGFSEHREMLNRYAMVDIALDTFPHCGGTTTMEALWQGVPLLSLYGTRQSMQHGKAILESIGHKELVAYTEDEFIKKAVNLASDPSRLVSYRQHLREDFRCSPKADEKMFVKNLEDAYHDMWTKYVSAL